MAVIVRQFEISSRVYSPVVCVCVFPCVWLKNAKWECVERRTDVGAASTGAKKWSMCFFPVSFSNLILLCRLIKGSLDEKHILYSSCHQRETESRVE